MADLSSIEGTVGLWSFGDFKPEMPTVSGATALIHRLCVRLQTPRGRFPWWPNFGTDMNQYLLSKQPPRAIAAAAEAECRKDEQVKEPSCVASRENGGRTIRLDIRIVTSDGPYAFTLLISQARTELIALQQVA